MNHYSDENRGKFQNVAQAKQIISYEGMLFEGRSGVRNVTPTDIDGFIQLEVQDTFIFIETKHHGNLPKGQEDSLERLSDVLYRRAGNEVIVIVTEHSTPQENTVLLRDTAVKKYLHRGEWHIVDTHISCLSFIEQYIEYLNKRIFLYNSNYT